jgi:glucosylceramidase
MRGLLCGTMAMTTACRPAGAEHRRRRNRKRSARPYSSSVVTNRAFVQLLTVLMGALALAGCGSTGGLPAQLPAQQSVAPGLNLTAGGSCRPPSPSAPAVSSPSTVDAGPVVGQKVQVWETTGSGGELLAPQSLPAVSSSGPVVTVDPPRRLQTMLGFGGTMTDVSAELLRQDLSSSAYDATMSHLFSPSAGIGLDLLRVPIGGNDFSLGNYAGKVAATNNYNEDPGLGDCFSIAHDQAALVPVLKDALRENPSLQLIATPWSAPGWMKTGGTAYDGMDGGQLNSRYILEYAQYLVDFLVDYRAVGIPIHYLSLQNEPEHQTLTYPSMLVSATQEEGIAAAVDSDLRKAGLSGVSILGFDHNWYYAQPSGASQPFPQALMSSPQAGDFAGIAFHCYGDTSDNPAWKGQDPHLAQPFYAEFPSVPWYETECTPEGPFAANPTPVNSTGAPESTQQGNFSGDLAGLTGNTAIEDIQSIRDGSGSVMLYDIVADAQYGPTINSGCTSASFTCLPLVVDKHGLPPYQVGYDVLGQLSKFVAPGAVQVGSSVTGHRGLHVVAFQNLNHTVVLLVLNAGRDPTTFTVASEGRRFTSQVPADAVQSYIWNGTANPASAPTTTTTQPELTESRRG